MELSELRLPPAIWAATPCAAQALILAQRKRIRELESPARAELGQLLASPFIRSAPDTSAPEGAALRKEARGQRGHPGALRALLPIDQVDEIVAVMPERCRHCQQPLPEPAGRHRGRVWRHQVVELLPLALRVTEYQMAALRCPACGKRTRAALPSGVPRRPFGLRLTAVIALLSGRYRLSRREVQQLLQDLWQVRVSLGAVVHQEQAQSAALALIAEEARAAAQQAAILHMDETGWREAKQRAWLWTVVTATLTVFRIDRCTAVKGTRTGRRQRCAASWTKGGRRCGPLRGSRASSHQQCSGACPAARGAVAQGQLRLG